MTATSWNLVITCSHGHGYNDIWQALKEGHPGDVGDGQPQGSSCHEQGEDETSSEARTYCDADSDQLHDCYDQQQLRGVVILLERLKTPDSALRPDVWKGS